MRIAARDSTPHLCIAIKARQSRLMQLAHRSTSISRFKLNEKWAPSLDIGI